MSNPSVKAFVPIHFIKRSAYNCAKPKNPKQLTDSITTLAMIAICKSVLLIAFLSATFAVAPIHAQDESNQINLVKIEISNKGNSLVGGDDCVVDFDPDTTVDYFPDKYIKPVIKSYSDVDIYGDKFVPHNTTDYLEITYHNTYKIVTNKHQDPPLHYLLYQCGTIPPQDVIDDPNNNFQLVLPVPHKGGLAISQTPQIPYIEMLGLRKEVIAYVGDPQYVTSPCLDYMLGDNDDNVTMTEIVHSYNDTEQLQLTEDFLQRNPNAIIFSGPTNNVVGDRVMVASATQERTNVATFDWISFYASLYNLEGEASRIASKMQASYDCSSDVARDVAEQQRSLSGETEENKPVILWANYISWQNLGWSVAECPTWDAAYYCEYATHCDAHILSRPEGFGYNKTWGSPTVYWYLSDEEFLEMGRDADVLIYSGSDFDKAYELKNETLDQIKAVQNKQVFDTLGQGPSAWHEQRYAEYDVVGLDMCDVVGRVNPNGSKHQRRWFRNVYDEPVGSLGSCNVPEELSQPFVPPEHFECVRLETESNDESAGAVVSHGLSTWVAHYLFVLVVTVCCTMVA